MSKKRKELSRNSQDKGEKQGKKSCVRSLRAPILICASISVAFLLLCLFLSTGRKTNHAKQSMVSENSKLDVTPNRVNAEEIPAEAPSATSLASEEEALQAADEGLGDLMRHLQGDRFSEAAGKYLRAIEGRKGPQQFAARCLQAFWHLHRNQLSEAKKRFDWILRSRTSPSKMSERIVALWRNVVNHMQKQDEHDMGRERLLEEREAFAELRRSLTLAEGGKKWLYEDLFHTEGMWLIQQLPDHNNKDNSKCLYVPGLLAREYHDASSFSETRILEAKYPEIMQELTPFLERARFYQVGGNTAHTDSNLVLQGKWSDVSLFSAGTKNEDACAQLPVLCSLLEQELPEVTKNVKGHALLSRMEPGTVVKRHHGSSNCQLTMHLGLIIPRGAGIEVNGKEGRWERGKVLVFDDSFYHSVWHRGAQADGPRLVLLLRGYHPEWTLEERAGLIMSHNETPWTPEERLAEVEHLWTASAQERWKTRKHLFQNGLDATPPHIELRTVDEKEFLPDSDVPSTTQNHLQQASESQPESEPQSMQKQLQQQPLQKKEPQSQPPGQAKEQTHTEELQFRGEPLESSEPSTSQHSLDTEEEPLQAADSGLADIMRHLNGDRFSDTAGKYLRGIEGKKGPRQFAARCLQAFWHLHRNRLSETKKRFDWILKNDKSPSRKASRHVSLWRNVLDHMQKQEKHEMGEERLIQEREAFAELRRSLTLREDDDKKWLYEDLFQTEAMWLIQKLPDHNNKNNSKCLYVPGLLAKEYHESSSFSEPQILEAKYEEIMQELNPFLDRANFHQVGSNTAHTDSNLVVRGRWSDVSLFSAGSKNLDACAQLPMLCALLERELPEVTKNVKGHALLSRMEPGTVVKRHHGSSNCQLTMHLGLIIPRGAGIEVNSKKGRWEEGKVLVFDDSFHHSVWHKGALADGPRLVLLLRGYHPEWTLEERAGLILNHNETPWTMEERLAEVEDLSTPAAQERWRARKHLFQRGPGAMSSR